MTTKDNFIEYLNTFSNVPNSFIHELEEKASIVQIEKNHIYFKKYTYSKKLGFLSKGVMRIYDIDSDGQEWNKVFLSSPSLILGNPNITKKSIHYIETITPCEILEIPIDFLNEALKKYPEIKEIQTKIILHLFEKKSVREYDFLTLTAKERYVKFIKNYGDLIHQIPQFHIASYLGITPTQLSRINLSIKNQQM